MEALAITGWMLPAKTVQPAEEARLINRARTDPEAMAQLFRDHYSRMVRYVSRRTGNAAVTDDLVSEVFLTMVRYLPRYRIGQTPFQAWLYRLATNQVNRWARRQRRYAWQQLQDYAAPDHVQTDEDETLKVRAALLTLPLHYQSALALHYLEEMNVEDVAQVLGCAIGTVKSRLARGRELLRPLLSEQDA